MSFVGDSEMSGNTSSLLGVNSPREGLVIGRHYVLHRKIGTGGMATVYLGWLVAPADFMRVVAIKRLHPRLADDEHFVSRFQDEARLNACLSHPNIVQVFDVVEQNRELLIVMEYIHGVPLDRIAQDAKASGLRLPLPVVSGVLAPALHALHAIHEATDDQGMNIGTVHRDFTPPNIMVTCEGYSKLLDLGVAKARTHEHETSPGKFAGKLGYCSPEQMRTGAVDRRTDVFAAGILIWELLTGKYLFHRPDNEIETIRCVLELPVPPPSSLNPDVPKALDEIVLRAVQRAPEHRFATARELAFALEEAVNPARPSVIAEWLGKVSARRIAKLTRRLDRTRRCMARPRIESAPIDLSQEETLRWFVLSNVGAVPKARASEKTTVRQPDQAGTIDKPVKDSGKPGVLHPPEQAAITNKAAKDSGNKAGSLLRPEHAGTKNKTAKDSGNKPGVLHPPKQAAIPNKTAKDSGSKTDSLILLARVAIMNGAAKLRGNKPSLPRPPEQVGVNDWATEDSEDNSGSPRPPAQAAINDWAAPDNKPSSQYAHRLKRLTLGAVVIALATGGSVGRRWIHQPAAPSAQPAPAPQVVRVRHSAPEVVLLPSPPPDPVPAAETPAEVALEPVVVAASSEKPARDVPARARVPLSKARPRPSKPSGPPDPLPAAETPAEVALEPVVVATSSEKPARDVPARARVPLSKARPRPSKPSAPRKAPPQTLVVRQVESQPDCDPPTYLGEDGIRFFKIECL